MPLFPEGEVSLKRFARLAVLAGALLACSGSAGAQLSNILDNKITDAVAKRVEDSVVGKVVSKVEDSVVGQVVDKVEDSVVSRVEDQVEIKIDQLVGGVVDNKVTQSITNGVERTLDPLTSRIDPITGKLEDTANQVVDQVNRKLPPILGREVVVENNWRAVDHEWLALVTPDQVAALRRANVTIISQTPLAATGQVLVRVRVSDQDEVAGRAQAILRAAGASAADRNHIFGANKGPAPSPAPAPAPAPSSYKGQARIGLIDTDLNLKHPSLKKANIVEKDFVDGKNPRPTAHGTAIASVLVGGEKEHEGLLPKGQLVAASVFYSGEKGAGGATTSSLVQSLDWMASQHVAVVNMSLAGPPNEVLGVMIAKLSAQGMLVVAAVGNDGPASRPLYPAAFEPVVAVTAVDSSNKVYRWANQGPQVKVAAYGVDASVARDKGGYDVESGTSFAAPIVAAALAELVADGASTPSAYKTLISSAQDLGPPGRDDIYGYGLVKPALVHH